MRTPMLKMALLPILVLYVVISPSFAKKTVAVVEETAVTVDGQRYERLAFQTVSKRIGYTLGMRMNTDKKYVGSKFAFSVQVNPLEAKKNAFFWFRDKLLVQGTKPNSFLQPLSSYVWVLITPGGERQFWRDLNAKCGLLDKCNILVIGEIKRLGNKYVFETSIWQVYEPNGTILNEAFTIIGFAS